VNTIYESVDRSVLMWTCTLEVPGTNLGCITDSSECRMSWFYSSSSSEYSDGDTPEQVRNQTF
jgi:hypothetical protein